MYKTSTSWLCEMRSHIGLIFLPFTVATEATLTPAQDHYNKVEDWPVYVLLTNGKAYGCDLVVSATGIVPNSDVVKISYEQDRSTQLQLSTEDGGGILVDSEMRSSLRDVYAAGDVCTVRWKDQPPLWFQVRQ